MRLAAKPTVFLDRDGTINVDHGYVHRSEQLELIPGAARAIARLNHAGFLVIVVTNQSGVARGYYGEEDVRVLHSELSARLALEAARIDAFYFCPYHPTEGNGAYRLDSALRKPGLGMFEQASRDFAIDASRSWMIGDKEDDMEFARRAGLRGVRVGPEGKPARDLGFPRAATLVEAVDIVLTATA